MFSSPKDYVGIQLESDVPGYDNSKSRRRQSCWRTWNRLSSLQRSVICLVLIMGTMSGMYMFPILYKSYFPNTGDMDSLTRNRSRQDVPFQPALPSFEKKFAQNAVQDIKRRAREQVINNGGKVPGKRGPPGRKEGNPVVEVIPKPEEVPVQQIKPPKLDSDSKDPFPGPQNEKQAAVVQAFKHAWSAYKKYAWGRDELKPLSRTHSEWFGVGLTLIDSLDTMYIMGLKDEFLEAREWVATKLSLDVNKDVNLFETTIRVLGGLLSTYHLSGDKIFLEKARELGDRLLPAFNSGSKVPYSDVNLKTHAAHAPRWGPDSSTAEISTIQLEFRDLSRATGDPKYEEAIDRVTNHLHSLPKKDGLVPIFINAQTGKFRSSATITLGARGDSYYEYLLKIWLQTGKTKESVKQDYLDGIEGVKKHLLRESEPNKLTYIGELLGSHSFSPKMDHLVCFMAGALALGAHNGLPQDHHDIGVKLGKTCFEMYRKMPTGLSPEIVYFNVAEGNSEDIIVKPADAHNLQRPETVESLFYLYRLTGDKMYREWGWKIFNSFEKYTKLSEGYSSINNVRNPGNVGFRDKMESFFLGETLKYLYLLFSDDDSVSLDKVVFNTEGHPLPIYKV